MTMQSLPRLTFARAVRLARRRGTLRDYVRVDRWLGRAAVIADRVLVTDGTTVPHCPDCGSVLDVDPCCVIEEPVLTPFLVAGRPLKRRTRIGRAYLCTGCEYCIEASEVTHG
jgi:hypothetical protein